MTVSRRDGYFITLRFVEQAAQRTASIELAVLAGNMVVESGQAGDPAYPYDWSDVWGTGNVKSAEEAFGITARFIDFEISGTDDPQASIFLKGLEQQATGKSIGEIWEAWIDAARAPIDLAPPSPWLNLTNPNDDADLAAHSHIFIPTKAQSFCERIAESARNIFRKAFHYISVQADPTGYTDSLCVINYGAMDFDMRLRANVSLTVEVDDSNRPQNALYDLKARLQCWYDGLAVLETSNIVCKNGFGAGEPSIDEELLLRALATIKCGE